MAVDKSKDTKILNTLHSTISGTNKLAHADEIYDEEFVEGNYNQHKINEILYNKTAGTQTDLAAKIEAETNRAKAAESTLTNNLNAEINNRKAGDTALQTAINTEKSRAEAAEQDIRNKYLPLTGGTTTGSINAHAANDIQFGLQTDAGTDSARFRLHNKNNQSDNGELEIAVSDNGTEPIVVRQYIANYGTSGINGFGVVHKEAYLLDSNGNSAFPGNVTVNSVVYRNKTGEDVLLGNGTTKKLKKVLGQSLLTDNGSDNITIPNASTTTDGLLSKTDKAKLDNLENNLNSKLDASTAFRSVTGTSVKGSGDIVPTHIVNLGLKTVSASGGNNSNPHTGMAITSGLSVHQSYNDPNAPVQYGNILNVAGAGDGQLALGWSGDNSTGSLYYRSHRDNNQAAWSAWKRVPYDDEIVNPDWNSTTGKSQILNKPNTFKRTNAGDIGWAGSKGYLVSVDAIAFWNGAYQGTASNLKYCARGEIASLTDVNNGINSANTNTANLLKNYTTTTDLSNKLNNYVLKSDINSLAAGFGTPQVDYSKAGNSGSPKVTITASGPNTAKVFNFTFENLKGEKGADGTGINIKGSLTGVNQLPATGKSGDAYLIDGSLYVYVGTGGNVAGHTQWSNAGSIKGPKGDRGNDGTNGTNGTNGKDGKDGQDVEITTTLVQYAVSTNGTTAPTTGWQTDIPATSAGQYLWSKTIVNYSTGTRTTTYGISYHGDKGDKGDPGQGSSYTLPTASSGNLGGVKLYDNTRQTTAVALRTNVSERTYAVQLNSNDQMVVNVPWEDTGTTDSAIPDSEITEMLTTIFG